jgi:hypothetical protein
MHRLSCVVSSLALSVLGCRASAACVRARVCVCVRVYAMRYICASVLVKRRACGHVCIARQTQTKTIMSTLCMVDLAGSERAAKTKNAGRELREGANINKSLLALGR